MEELLSEKEQKELYPNSHTLRQGTPNNEPEPTFKDSVNNYEQLLINRKGSLKPERYSLIDEWKRGDLGGALNQNIDQWFVDKWEGLGPDNQKLIQDGIELIKAAKTETKSNWAEYPVESTLWHTVDFLGGILGPVYQFGTDATAKFVHGMLGINEDIVKKANVFNQVRTGKVFPFLPTRIPGVRTQILPGNQALPPATKGLRPVPGSEAKNITDWSKILEIIDNPKYSAINRARQIKDFTSGSLPKNSLFSPNYRPPNLMFAQIDGKQLPLWNQSSYDANAFKTLSDELIKKSEGFVLDYKGSAKYNSTVFKPLMDRIGGEQSFYSILANNPRFSKIEHIIAKGPHMDFYWDMKKKDRHSPNNVRLLLNDKFDKFKNTAETVLFGNSKNNYSGIGLVNPDPKQRIILGLENLPMMKKANISPVAQNQPGDLVLKKAGSGKIIGRLGEYLDILYSDEEALIQGLIEKGIIKTTYTREKPKPGVTKLEPGQVNVNLRKQIPYSDSSIQKQLTDWRTKIIKERIELIVAEAPNLKGLSQKKINQIISKALIDDMTSLRDQYPFISSRFDRAIDNITKVEFTEQVGGETFYKSSLKTGPIEQVPAIKGGGTQKKVTLLIGRNRRGRNRRIVAREVTLQDGTKEYYIKGSTKINKDGERIPIFDKLYDASLIKDVEYPFPKGGPFNEKADQFNPTQLNWLNELFEDR